MSTDRKNKWLQPGFLTVVVLLGISAVGLNSAVGLMKLHFLKVAVPLKKDLATVPSTLGDWVQVSTDEPLDKETQDILATDKYIFRDYVNTKVIPASELRQFDGKTSLERKQLVAALQAHYPDAVISFAVTYYTGKVDTVAHIPERCYVADGYQPTDSTQTVGWDLGPNRLGKTPGESQKIDVRYLNFQDQTNAARQTKRVAYFFFVNGRYESDSLRVRQALENLRATHAFYSKVELMAIIPDEARCAAVMSSFLRSALPEVEKCLPDWNSIENGGSHPAGQPAGSVAQSGEQSAQPAVKTAEISVKQ
jgi:hypothetical protein